ncbi:MAG: glycosyltransferase [Dehalococcoidia bacterium]
MTEPALQIDFQPQPRGIVVVTSVPIASITQSGHYSMFQDLIDGYASSFQKVFIFSPSGDRVVQPVKKHRVSWYSGPKWLSPTNGLLWSVLKNRSVFKDVELVRTFGPRAGVVGKAISKFTKSQHVSSSDDLVDNLWRDKTGWRSTSTGLVNKMGVLKADMLAATVDWELEYLSEAGYEKDLLIGAMGMLTDIFTPVGTTDPDRHPVVLWAGSVAGEESASLIEDAAFETQKMIENVEFVVVARADEADQLKEDAAERDIPVTVATLDAVEPLVDLIERAWACVTVPNREFPHGLAMLALSAGVPLISIGELATKHGFHNHLNYIGIESDDPEAVAYALQLLRRWTTWSLRIGTAGQKLVEQRYSTRTVAVKEGQQLARIARNEEIESATVFSEPKVLREYLSPATGEVPAFLVQEPSDEDESIDEDQYSGAGFDLVASVLADLSDPKPTVSDKTDAGLEIMSSDAIAALFAANDADPEMPSEEPVDISGAVIGQDAISALFATNDADPEVTAAEPEAPDSGDMDQDVISAVFAANDADGPESGEIELDQEHSFPVPEVKNFEYEEESSEAEITMVQFSVENTPDSETDLDDMELDEPDMADDADDIDQGLISSILEGKDVDPSL